MLHGFRGEANVLYPTIINTIRAEGDLVETRGTTSKELHPAYIELNKPQQNIITSWGRNINVAFALAEVLWILSGRRDVGMLSHYNSKISQWSDNGITFNAPYGHRLRYGHGYDQIEDVILTLQNDPGSRQAVLTIWHPDDRGWLPEDSDRRVWQTDLPPNVRNETKDRACNVMAHLMIRNGKLDWLQVVRSNDIILGVPHNWIQWTGVQQYIAARLGVPTGRFCYLADSLHMYEDTYYDPNEIKVDSFNIYDYLPASEPMFTQAGHQELNKALNAEAMAREGFVHDRPDLNFWESAAKIFVAHSLYKNKSDVRAAKYLAHGVRDKVLSAVAFKFYYWNRWMKLDTYNFSDLAYANWPGPVAEWISWRSNPNAK